MRLSASSHLAMRDLLLVAAGEGAGARPQRALVDLDAAEDLARPPRSRALPSMRPTRAKRVDHRQRGVVLAAELQEQGLGLAVLRHQADADVRRGSHRRARSIATGGRRPRYRRCSISAMPKQARKRSSWPMPCRPAMPRISPSCRSKADIPRACAPADRSLAPQHRLAALSASRRAAAERSGRCERPMIMR